MQVFEVKLCMITANKHFPTCFYKKGRPWIGPRGALIAFSQLPTVWWWLVAISPKFWLFCNQEKQDYYYYYLYLSIRRKPLVIMCLRPLICNWRCLFPIMSSVSQLFRMEEHGLQPYIIRWYGSTHVPCIGL